MPRFVLHPDVGFDDVVAAFAGWTGGALDRRPWLAGEPVAASWSSGSRCVDLSTNPVIGLRVLDVTDGPPDGLRLMTSDEAVRLADEPDTARAMLGATALGLLGDTTRLVDLDRLADDPRGPVAAAVELARARLVGAALRAGMGRLAADAQSVGAPAALFRRLPPRLRRQVVRELAADLDVSDESLHEVVIRALDDDDAEVRWTAVLAAGRRGLTECVGEIARCDIGDGWAAADRRVLAALRDAIGWRLTGSDDPRARHLIDCVHGRAPLADRAALVSFALLRPLPSVVEPTLDVDGNAVVGAVPHVLGDPDVAGLPLRTVVPAPFRVAAHPSGPVEAGDVADLLASLGDDGTPYRLPTLSELEMAARGPDGRRFPWGNLRTERARWPASPWGLVDALREPEWAFADDGDLVALGGRSASCAGPCDSAAATALLRPVRLFSE